MLRNDLKTARLILSSSPRIIDCVRFVHRCCYATVERMEKGERERGNIGGIKGRPISKGSRRNSVGRLQSEPLVDRNVCRNV